MIVSLQTVLREEVKDRFNYEVDRTSPTNKLREFLAWSKAIMDDIKYQKKILSNPLSRFFVKSGYVSTCIHVIFYFWSVAHFDIFKLFGHIKAQDYKPNYVNKQIKFSD